MTVESWLVGDNFVYRAACHYCGFVYPEDTSLGDAWERYASLNDEGQGLCESCTGPVTTGIDPATGPDATGIVARSLDLVILSNMVERVRRESDAEILWILRHKYPPPPPTVWERLLLEDDLI